MEYGAALLPSTRPSRRNVLDNDRFGGCVKIWIAQVGKLETLCAVFAFVQQVCLVDVDAGVIAPRSYREYVSACKIGSDAVLVVRGLSGANDAGLKEVDFPSAVHLAFYKLELGNLPLCLSIRPRRTDRGTHGCPVFGDTIGEGRDQA